MPPGLITPRVYPHQPQSPPFTPPMLLRRRAKGGSERVGSRRARVKLGKFARGVRRAMRVGSRRAKQYWEVPLPLDPHEIPLPVYVDMLAWTEEDQLVDALS